MLPQQEALYFKAGTDPEAGLWGGGLHSLFHIKIVLNAIVC